MLHLKTMVTRALPSAALEKKPFPFPLNRLLEGSGADRKASPESDRSTTVAGIGLQLGITHKAMGVSSALQKPGGHSSLRHDSVADGDRELLLGPAAEEHPNVPPGATTRLTAQLQH